MRSTDLNHYWRPPWLLALSLLIALSSAAPDVGATMLIRHQPPDALDGDQRDNFAIALLHLAMEQTADDYGHASIHQISVRMTQDRAIREMRRGRYLDVFWGMTNRERERELRPIRIPMTQGLLGVRALIAPEPLHERIVTVRSLEELAEFRFGQGHDWPDTPILEHNGLRVTTSSSYHSLFRMLQAGRFDIFPRGINEIQAETELYDAFGLQPSTDVLLAYYAPNYFFVHPDDALLAERIETGLRRAITDGSFATLLGSHPSTRYALELLTLGQPRVLALDNPQLPDATPIHDQSLWYAPLFEQLPVPDSAR